MSLSWMAYVLFIGSVLGASALAVDGILHRVSLPTRWAWIVAMIGCVVLAIVAPRQKPVASDPASTTGLASLASTSRVAESPRGLIANIEAARVRAYTGLTRIFLIADRATTPAIVRAIEITWLGASLGLLVILVATGRRMHGESRGWPVTRISGALVRVAPSVGPAVVGFSDPEIVVPGWLLEKSLEEQKLVIVHENEHLRARDQMSMIVGSIVVAVLPWHPAAWWMMSRLRLAIELDCDARVLRRGVHARSYGTLLIDIAGQSAGHRVGALALADRQSHLERRLKAMQNTRHRFTNISIATLAAVATTGILAACEAKLPTASEISAMDVASAQKAAAPLLMTSADSVETEYYVDGRRVTKAEAIAVSASRIVSLEVSKAINSALGQKPRIEIATVGSDAANAASVRMNRLREGNATTAKPLDIHIPSGKDVPIVIVDGVVARDGVPSTLRREQVDQVEVIKGAAAIAAYGENAKNGVILITTKPGNSGTSDLVVTQKTQPANARP